MAVTPLLAVESEQRVRSSILLRLPGFVHWPKSSDFNDTNTAYRLCIFRDRDYFNFIREYLGEKTVRGLPIEFKFTRDLEELTQCHIAYVGDVSSREIKTILSKGLLSQTIFVGSSEESAASGLHIRLYVSEKKKFDIEVNQAAFNKSKTELTVQFLKHASKVYSGDDNPGSS